MSDCPSWDCLEAQGVFDLCVRVPGSASPGVHGSLDTFPLLGGYKKGGEGWGQYGPVAGLPVLV